MNMNTIKAFVQRKFNKMGFQITQLPKFENSLKYQTVKPLATYSPWNTDSLFNEMYTAIQEFTLVDTYRRFQLWKLIEQSSKLPKGAIIEIGVWRGGTGALIAKQVKECGILSQVYLCDTFTGIVKSGSEDATYKVGDFSDTTKQVVENLIFKQMNLDNVQILEGIFPDDTSHEIDDLQFRFCHIDVDVYQSAKDIVDWIWDRMVPGGIIVYDDYGFMACDGITKFVEEQTHHEDSFVLHNLSGQAVVIKL